MDAKLLQRRQRSNQIVSKIIPPLLILVVIYASWVFVGSLCVEYLLNPAPATHAPQRIAVGIALPIVYFCLMLPMAAAYLRLLYVVQLNPGFVPRGRQDMAAKPAGRHEESVSARSSAPTTAVMGHEDWHMDYKGILEHRLPAPPGIEDFYTKDVFVCDANGLPLWCPICRNWKPDRCHHSSDIGRCVMKMDHFCPWVSGCVGENSFKFFVQFNFYATIYTAYTLACMAVFVAESEKLTSSIGNVHWVVVIGLAGFFCFFTFGLNLMSFQMTLNELTTIENIDAGMRSMFLAVLLPPEIHDQPNLPYPPMAASRSRTATPPSRSDDSSRPLTSEIDDPAHVAYFAATMPSRSRRRSPTSDQAASHWQGTITYPLYIPSDRPPLPAPEQRTFAILRTPPGLNPFNCGAYHNFTSVFGRNLHDWLLPIKYSPCTRHDTAISSYAMGWEFQQLLEDARLTQSREFVKKASRRGSSVHRKKRKRKRKLDGGWQNGERPDGWAMEKEAKRMRREGRQREGEIRGEV